MTKVSHATVYFLNSSKAIEFYMRKDTETLVQELKAAGDYYPGQSFEQEDSTDEDICEYAFDVTNNPSRQDEREFIYGRGRSVSIGDIVSVDGNEYLCNFVGWVKL